MSIAHLLTQRCTVLRIQGSMVDGIPVHDWKPVVTRVPIRIDLSFVRLGKDPSWTPETGRAADRTGVAFANSDAPLMTGDRVLITSGPLKGQQFELDGAVDPVYGQGGIDHLEVGVTEVAKPLAVSQVK